MKPESFPDSFTLLQFRDIGYESVPTVAKGFDPSRSSDRLRTEESQPKETEGIGNLTFIGSNNV